MPTPNWPSLDDLGVAWPIYQSAYGDNAAAELLSTLIGNGWARRDAVATVTALATEAR
jgi:hypothetical protein